MTEDSKPAYATECDPVFKKQAKLSFKQVLALTSWLLFFLKHSKSVVENPQRFFMAFLFCGEFYLVVWAGTGGLGALGQPGLHSRSVLLMLAWSTQ